MFVNIYNIYIITCIYMYIHVAFYVSIYLFMYVYMYLSIYLYICLSVYLAGHSRSSCFSSSHGSCIICWCVSTYYICCSRCPLF